MKKYKGRLIAAAVALTLVTTCLLGGTLAKYTTTVTGTGTATVAKWSFKANDQTATFNNVSLSDTVHTENIKAGTIAPGTDGSFDIKIDGSGSEVGIAYKIVLGDLDNLPVNIKFYQDEAHSTEYTEIATTGITGEIEQASVSTPVTKTIYWNWPIGDADTNDTTTGMTGAGDKTFTITVTGTQVAPAETPTT